MPLEEAGVSLIAEGGSEFEGTLRGANEAMSSFGGVAESVGSGIDVVSEVITGALRAVGEIAVTSLLAAGSAVVDFLGDSFAGALEAEQTMARLGQVIESTGGIAGVTVGEAEALADEFKNLAGGSDDAIISIIDMGLRMGTVSEEEMPSFIQSTLDLGAVMGDAGKAAQLMARAQEDPVGVLGALRKAGILVNETTEAQIKAMVASGDTAGAYALVMDRVGEATMGAAETMALTTAGQWAIFQETIADAGESIVGAFLPALNGILTSLMPIVPVITEIATAFVYFFETLLSGNITEAIDGLVEFDSVRAIFDALGLSGQAFYQTSQAIGDFITNNWPAVQQTATTVFTAIQGVLQVVGDFVTGTLMPALATIWEQTGIQLPSAQATFESVMSGIVVATQLVSDFITNVLVPVLTAAVAWVVANWPAIQATAIEVWGQVQTAINTAVTFIQGLLDSFLPQITTNVSTTLSGLTAFWEEHGASIMATVETSFNTMATVISVTLGLIGATVSTALTLLSGTFAATMQIVNGDWSGAWTTITSTLTTAMNGILSLVGQDLASFTSIWTTNWEMAVMLVEAAWDAILSTIIGVGVSILLSINGLIDNIIGAFNIDWASIGIAVIQGIANGISGAVGGLVNAAVNAANDAFNAARSALGISSPSTLFSELGAQTMAGMSLGIQTGVSDAAATMQNAAIAVGNAFIDTNAQIGDTAGAAFVDSYAYQVSTLNSIMIGVQTSANNALVNATDTYASTIDALYASLGGSGSYSSPPPMGGTPPPMTVPPNAFGGGPVHGPPMPTPMPSPGVGPSTGGTGVTINLDARGASPSETQRAVGQALQTAGQYSDVRLRMRGAM